MTAFPVYRRLSAALALILLGVGCSDILTPSRAPRYPADHPSLPGEIFRWPAARLPVRYFADTRGPMRALVARGLNVWEQQFLYGEFRAQLVADSTSADVIVVWEDSVPPDAPPDTAGAVGACGGITTILIDSTNTITEALRVRVSVSDSFTTAQVAACLPRVTAHELGHSIGLLRHSSGPDDLMFGAPRVDVPSVRDRRTAEVLYHTPATIQPPPR
ncbi:MAG TPA: hypothetical protein VGQ48_13035 [Gemmatimonadales bacterium]|jgi:hypothetical protein|nr:hypothetical protein [Gemmatimonadales bacterium]